MNTPDEDRRSFSSRTPASQMGYRRGFVTRHQVSGWRFLMRRIASGMALHDTRMLVDPLRTQSRAVLVGALILVTAVAGCFVFSLIRPGGVVGTAAVLADRDTAALYVRVGDQVHPVLNLASARLIAGAPDNPTSVKTSELDQFPRGNLLGIPGAPERMAQNASRDADWTVCDAVSGTDAGVTLIAGPPADGGERAAELPADHAVLAQNDGRTWLLWGGKRSAVDLADRAVTDALGFGVEVPAPRPIAAGLFNAIPEAPALAAPVLPGAGEPPRFPLPVSAPVGAVLVSYDADNTLRHYVVLADGVQPVPPVLAALLRNANSFGLDQPPRLAADEVSRLPVAKGVDVTAYPADPVTLISATESPVTCATWAKPEGATAPSLTLRSGAVLPLPDGLRTVALVSAGSGGVADRVALAAGRGYLVDSAGALFWIGDTGVRYGIEDDQARAALGLTRPPLPIPWSVLSQFASGPTLSAADALIAHDALPPDPRPAP